VLLCVRLLEEGCGSQVTILRHPYVFPAYAPNHSYNPHLLPRCRSPPDLGSPSTNSMFLFPQVCYKDELRGVASYFIPLWTTACLISRHLTACVFPAWRCGLPLIAPIGGRLPHGRPFACGTRPPILSVKTCSRSGVTREYMYRTFVQADPALAVGILRDIDRSSLSPLLPEVQ
jgi:hypothetical protein